MVTSFTRIVVVLSLLRAALGTQTAPPNAVLVSLALFLTAFVMAPVFSTAYDTAVQPLIAGQIQPQEAFERGQVPFRTFMLEACAGEGPAAVHGPRERDRGLARRGEPAGRWCPPS